MAWDNNTNQSILLIDSLAPFFLDKICLTPWMDKDANLSVHVPVWLLQKFSLVHFLEPQSWTETVRGGFFVLGLWKKERNILWGCRIISKVVKQLLFLLKRATKAAQDRNVVYNAGFYPLKGKSVQHKGIFQHQIKLLFFEFILIS